MAIDSRDHCICNDYCSALEPAAEAGRTPVVRLAPSPADPTRLADADYGHMQGQGEDQGWARPPLPSFETPDSAEGPGPHLTDSAVIRSWVQPGTKRLTVFVQPHRQCHL
jgi:hypothetical protein